MLMGNMADFGAGLGEGIAQELGVKFDRYGLGMLYYINPTWDPELGDCGGGLDIYLTDPKETPQSAASAKSAGKLRIAPHADTLVLFLSERMAHNVIETSGSDRWFCMTQWYLDGKAQAEAPKNLLKIQKELSRGKNGDDSD